VNATQHRYEVARRTVPADCRTPRLVRGALGDLLPSTAAVTEARRDIAASELFAVEEAALGRAVESRRREFVTSRACARKALRKLGLSEVAVGSGPHGEPLWPDGVIGSITHCRGYRAAAVARTQAVASLGIDAAVDRPLPDGVLRSVSSARERTHLAVTPDGAHMDTVLFSAKEAVYKAWFPLARRWLGFDDVELSIDVAAGTFRAELLVKGPIVAGERLTEVSGRWTVDAGIVLTAAVIDG
jgi:4'-phosphopantetheinyl transferase EntD